MPYYKKKGKVILGAFRLFGRLFLKICTGIGFLIIALIVTFLLINWIKPSLSVPKKTVLTLSLEKTFTEGAATHPLQLLFEEGGIQSFYKLLTTLKKAEKDPHILGLYVNTGTPSLGFAQIQELREAFLALRKAGKFVYFYASTFGEMAPASSFYYLATSADIIGIQPSGGVGLTGMGVEAPFLKKFMESVGITADFIRRGKYKTYPETFTEEKMSATFQESLETLLGSLSQQVALGISEGRHIPLDQVQELIQKGPFSDKEAQEKKLIDRLVYEVAFEKEVLEKAGEGAVFVPFAVYEKTLSAREKIPTSPQIALIFAEGTIIADRERDLGNGISFPSTEKIGDFSTLKLFKEIEENPTIKAVVYRVDSSGGHALASDAIREGLEKLKSNGKKVIISMGNTAASGGYLIALGGDEIIADAGTITGSIGAFCGKFVLANLWEKLGINWGYVETASNARLASMNLPFSEDMRPRIQSWVDDLYASFIERTAQARRLPLDEVKPLAEGRVWTGEQAQKYKLVDHVGGIFKALERARILAQLPENPLIVMYPQSKSFFDLLWTSFFDDSGASFFTLLKRTIQKALWSYSLPHSSAQFYEEPLKVR